MASLKVICGVEASWADWYAYFMNCVDWLSENVSTSEAIRSTINIPNVLMKDSTGYIDTFITLQQEILAVDTVEMEAGRYYSEMGVATGGDWRFLSALIFYEDTHCFEFLTVLENVSDAEAVQFKLTCL
jgi:hypothetical protein